MPTPGNGVVAITLTVGNVASGGAGGLDGAGGVCAAALPISDKAATPAIDISLNTYVFQAIGVSYKTVAHHCSQLKAKLVMPRMADLVRVAISCSLGRGDTQLANPQLAEDRPQS
jgi:hypothetical protein